LEHLEKPKEAIIKYRAEYRVYPFIETVTFHPSYSYQDFVEGISVETIDKNQIIYKAKDGIFKKICDRAIANPTYNYVLIIDEINRGDISSIFGELFTLLEDNKRKDENEEMSINLPYSKDDKGNPKRLTVPKNLHIVATMNTVDKSIALIDVALRRRFDFIECMPNYTLEEFKKYKEIDLAKLLQVVNERITILKNEHYQIGHSYFLNIDSREKFVEVMKKSIIPLLQEYFYDDWKSICAVLNQSYNTANDNKMFTVNQKNDKLFKPEFNELLEYQNKKIFRLKETFTIEDIKSIYA
jgi:5-methylcytosine-specific restriction protein B